MDSPDCLKRQRMDLIKVVLSFILGLFGCLKSGNSGIISAINRSGRSPFEHTS